MKKRAYSIEFYNSGLFISLPDYEDFGGNFGLLRKYNINGDCIKDLLDYLLLDYRPHLTRSTTKDGKIVLSHLEDFDLVINEQLRQYDITGLKEIWVDVLSPNLLELELLHSYKDGSEYRQLVTYSGSFLVSWLSE